MRAQSMGALGVAVAAAAIGLTTAATGSPPTALVPKDAVPLTVPANEGAVADGGAKAGAPAFACAAVSGARWYIVRAPHRGAMVARLAAKGELDGAIAVYRLIRSQRMPVLCAKTNQHGRARVAWYAYSEGSYLIGVARRAASAPGPFELTVRAAERPERPPGTPLPPEGIRALTNAVLDPFDVYSVQLNRGTTYRLNLTTASRSASLRYELYRPQVTALRHARPVFTGTGYGAFTPGTDGGGRYSVVVRNLGDDAVNHSYRVQIARAGPDDVAPGIALTNGQMVRGTLFGAGVDVLDMYRFDVPRPNELTTIELRHVGRAAFAADVLTETGARVGSIEPAGGRQLLREHLASGRYYFVVRTADRRGGAYSVQVRVRDVTATSVLAGGRSFLEVAPATPVPLTVQVSSASHGGHVIIAVDEFDPLIHWQFRTELRGDLDASGTFTTAWTPPSVGYFRVRARFVANPYSSFSESGYARVHVAAPLQ